MIRLYLRVKDLLTLIRDRRVEMIGATIMLLKQGSNFSISSFCCFMLDDFEVENSIKSLKPDVVLIAESWRECRTIVLQG